VRCRVVRAWCVHLDDHPGVIPAVDQLVIWATPIDPALAAALPYRGGSRHYTITMYVGDRMHAEGWESIAPADVAALVGRLCGVRPDAAKPGRTKFSALVPRGSSAGVTPMSAAWRQIAAGPTVARPRATSRWATGGQRRYAPPA